MRKYFTGFVKPICIPKGSLLSENFLNKTAQIAGWGAYDYNIKIGSDGKIEPGKSVFINIYKFFFLQNFKASKKKKKKKKNAIEFLSLFADRHNFTNRLKYVKIPMVGNERCQESFGYEGVIVSEDQFCAGGKAGEDSCKGDSGGPLMRVLSDKDYGPRYYLIGIISYGKKNCGSYSPALYTKVQNYILWILDHMIEKKEENKEKTPI